MTEIPEVKVEVKLQVGSQCYEILSEEALLSVLLQLNKYETDPYFLKNFQSNMTVCLIIHVFCKNCEPDIVLAVLQIKTKTISSSVFSSQMGLQLLQNAEINKQTDVRLWKI